MRLIDADTLIKQLEDWRGGKEAVNTSDQRDVWYYAGMGSAIGLAKFATTVDAVPVVRCKDCKHWKPCVEATKHVKCCEFAGYMVGENGYCVYGEARGDD